MPSDTTSVAAPNPPTGSSTAAGPAGAAKPAHAGDERIAHRGPMRRWLISPEIGALIGAVVVWLFLWGNGQTFGTAGTTLNWLDVAAPYGIMGTAIALLMIGGEFDLSSGVMTGASAMIIGLFSRFYMGSGVHIGLAILVAFLAAPAVGLFNGVMVNRTGLPSFIITLASFFAARGLMLVLSKRLGGKVYVDQIKDQRGAGGFGQWIAHEWRLTEFRGRDTIYALLVLVGGALFIAGLLEQSFIRRDRPNPKGLPILGIGLLGALGGFIALLRTDGVGANVALGGLAAAGTVAAIVGGGLARYQGHSERALSLPSGGLQRSALTALVAGLGAVVLACLAPIAFDRGERRAVLTWVPDGLRPVIVIAAALAGALAVAKTLLPKYKGTKTTGSTIRLVTYALYAALLVMTLTVCVLQLTTVQALRAIVMVVLGTIGVSLILVARTRIGTASRSWAVVISVVAAAALVVIGLVVRSDSSASRFHTVLPALLSAAATALVANALLEHFLTKRGYAFAPGDRRGTRLQIAGALLAIVGGVIRLVFTNFTAEHTAKLQAEGVAVPQNVLRQTVLWWVLVAGLGAYVLVKTKWGNWIFAVGGNKDAARAVGVPAAGVKVGLFMAVSVCSALSGTLIGLRYGTVQADQGTGLELEYIIGAVVGGCLMTGGYGTVIGASLGAAILAMSGLGFQTVAGWNSDARYAFLGGVLLVAVLVNTYIRKKAQEAR